MTLDVSSRCSHICPCTSRTASHYWLMLQGSSSPNTTHCFLPSVLFLLPAFSPPLTTPVCMLPSSSSKQTSWSHVPHPLLLPLALNKAPMHMLQKLSLRGKTKRSFQEWGHSEQRLSLTSRARPQLACGDPTGCTPRRQDFRDWVGPRVIINSEAKIIQVASLRSPRMRAELEPRQSDPQSNILSTAY